MIAEENHNVTQLLANVAAMQPEKPALVFRNRNVEQEITFGELWQRASSFGAGLRRCGFQSGQRAIIMIPMSIDLYIALLGVIKIGGVAVFVDPWIATKQIARFAAFSEPTAYIGIGKSHLLRAFPATSPPHPDLCHQRSPLVWVSRPARLQTIVGCCTGFRSSSGRAR
jgi:acyl-coenzyme A synthetase/AMP-(fatty) acid ligase